MVVTMRDPSNPCPCRHLHPPPPPVQTEAGRIGLEGCLCDDYYKIRELLYQQYAVV